MLRKLSHRFSPGRYIWSRRYTSSRSATAVISANKKFPARTWFFPKNTRAAIEKTARVFRPDIMILDLEDSVSLEEKPSLRSEYKQILQGGVLTGKYVFVRTSNLQETEEVETDIRIFTRAGITGFLLPKVETAEEVMEVEKMVGHAEMEVGREKGTTKLVPIAETPGAYFDLHKIALCSKRNVGIIAGSGDFTAGALCDDHSISYDLFFSKALLAAKTAGIAAVCGVHDKIDDYAGFEKYCIKMKQCGYNGSVVLTPKQLQMAQEIFQCTPRERLWVKSVLDSSKGVEAVKMVQPSIQESRQMIGPPHREKAIKMREIDSMLKSVERDPPAVLRKTIRGTQPPNGMSPQISIGEFISTPHEVTATESWKTLWDSAFLSTSGISNSHPRFSTATGYNSLPLPFSLAATITLAFAVSSLSYHARVHLCFKNMVQHSPLLAGDTVRAVFRLNSIDRKIGGDGNEYSVADTTHQLLNQDDNLVIEMDKLTMFSPTHCTIESKPNTFKPLQPTKQGSVYQQLLVRQPTEKLLPNCPQPVLNQGQLFVHDFNKVFGHSETRMLCTLLRIVNPHHHNIVRYQPTDILIPGPFVMAAGLGNAALDLGEVLYEEIPYCVNPNKVNFDDQIGTLTYVVDKKDIVESSYLEEVTVKHVALKNTDMELLTSMNIPLQLVEGKLKKPSEYEKICAEEIPMLLHKIACIVERKIVRVRPGFVRNRS